MSNRNMLRTTLGPGTSAASNKTRQMSQLHSQLEQLADQMANLETLVGMTAVQAESMRELGAYSGALLIAASKILGEEVINGGQAPSVESDEY